MNQAMLLACMYTEVGRGLGAVVAASCMSTAAAAMCPLVQSKRLSPRGLRRCQKLAIIFVCCLEVLVLSFCAAQGKEMASPDHIAKRRRLNSPPSDQGEPDDDYVCYGMVSPAVLLPYTRMLNTSLNSLSI